LPVTFCPNSARLAAWKCLHVKTMSIRIDNRLENHVRIAGDASQVP
jgi:hypothetical protein